MDPPFPELTATLEGWTLAEESVETLFEVPGARVRGATRRYVDERTRRAVREATGVHHEWRFVSATKLGFEPRLPPGAVPAVRPMVRREARESFADRLADRGLEQVTGRGSERVRLQGRGRTRLIRLGARDPVAGGVPVAGYVCVWTEGGEFLIVTGGHPDGRLADLLSVADPPGRLRRSADDLRRDFLDIVRSVA